MIHRDEAFTTNVTTLLQPPYTQEIADPKDTVNVKEKKVKSQDLNRGRSKVYFADVVYSSQVHLVSFIL